MKLNNWFIGRRARVAMTSGVAAILFAVFGASADAQTWNDAGGTGLWFDGTNWVGGAAPVGIADDAIVGLPSPVTLNGNVDLNSLTVTADGVVNMNPSLNLNFGGVATTTLDNAGTINVGNNSDLQFQNTVVNSGAINVNATTASTDIEVEGPTTLDGGGIVTLSGVNAGINGVGGGILTVADQTIQGHGNFGENTIGVVNQANGLIDANVNGQLLTFDASAAGVTNAGVMQATSGGNLRVSDTTVDNTGGTIVAADGSTVFLNSSTITNGVVESSGTGQVVLDTSTNVFLNDVTINGNMISQNNSDTGISGTITNTGTMQIAATTANTDIEVQAGGATLTGGGNVVLSGGNAGINGSGLLTIGDHTIEGQGSIGENAINVVNSATGLVDANVTGQTLTVNVDSNLDNDGTMQATGEGTLRFLDSNVDNGGGLIEAAADSTVSFNESSVSGGVINSIGTGQMVVETSSNVRFESLTNNGNIVSLNNSDTELSGTISNTGLIDVQATTANTDIEVQTGDATLTGGGTVKLTGSNAGINGLGGTVLTIGDQTIEGQGQIGENTMGVINSANGLVDANVAGQTLNVDTSSANDFSNNGTLRASDGGTLRITGTQMNNNSVIEALDGSKVELNDSTVTGGTLRSVDSGTVDVLTSTNSFFEDLTIEGHMRSFNSSDTGISGTIDNQGLMELLSTTTNTDIEVQAGGATLTGGGTVRLDGVAAGVNGVSNSVLTIGDQTVEGRGFLGENTMGFVNSANGLVDANVAAQRIEIDTDSVNNFTNNGTLRASDSGILRISNSQMNNNSVIEAFDGSIVELNNSTVTGGTLRSVGTGTVDVLVSTNSFLEDLTFQGHMRSLNNSDTGISGTIDNQGLIELVSTTTNTDIEVQAGGATLTGGGTVRLGGVAAGVNGVGGATLDIASQIVIGRGNLGENTIDIVNGVGGTIEADNAGQALIIDTLGSNTTTFFTNDGTLRASNGGILRSAQGLINNGTIDTTAGSEVEARTLSNSVGSLISGDGVVDVEFGSIDVAGTVAPGASAGTLTFLDDTVFSSTAVFEAELESDSLFDVLDVIGELALDGTLEVDLLGGFDPLSADTFLIATATDGIMGEFANVSNGGLLSTVGGEGTFVVNYTGSGVQLSNFTASAIPEPSAMAWLTGIGIGLMIRRRRKA